MLPRILLAFCVTAIVAHPTDKPLLLDGAIDFHGNTAPDAVPRFVSDMDLVRAARENWVRGIVLQNHFTQTADRAQNQMLQQRGQRQIEVFGGIVLNRSVGGLNAEAVRRMVAIDGKRGKVVWLPTIDAEHQVTFSKETRPFVSVVRNRKPVPELAEIFQIIAQNDLVLATGYSSADESLVLVIAARQAGVKRLLISDALAERSGAKLEHLFRFAELGAILECTWSTERQPTGPGTIHRLPDVAECAKTIKTVGAEHFLVSSDIGGRRDPDYVGGLYDFAAALKADGLTARDIDLLLRTNAAKLLGLYVIKAAYWWSQLNENEIKNNVQNQTVTVGGMVNRPGVYSVEEDATLRDIWHACDAPHQLWGRQIVHHAEGKEPVRYRYQGPNEKWLELLETVAVRPRDRVYFNEVE